MARTKKLVLAMSIAVAAAPCLAWAENAKLIVYVSPEPLGVDEFLKMGKTGTDAAAKALGAKSRTYEAKDPTTRKQNLEAAARDGADIVVALSFEYKDILPEVAAKNPNTKFLLVDACIENPLPNVWCSVFREYEAAYLAGAEMALTSKTGKIGSVMALDIPFMHRWSDAAAEGAKAARPDITISNTLYVGGPHPFSDPVRAEQQALVLLSEGDDRVLAGASGGTGGIFKAVKDKGAQAIGVDINQCPQSPGNILDNIEKKVDAAVGLAIKGILAGNQPHLQSYGLKEGGLSVEALGPDVKASQCTIAGSPDVIARVNEIAADIRTGKTVVADPMMSK